MTIVKNFQELENALKAHTYNIEISDEQTPPAEWP